jgi:hypothetical protein
MNAPEPTSAIKEAILAGNKIQAIKLYREQHGSGLAEAKEAVEKLEAELRGSQPGNAATSTSGRGCLLTLALLLGIGAAACVGFGSLYALK